MKIGVLIDRLNVGGVEKIAIEQVTALRKLGEDASLVVLREKAVVVDAFPELMKGIPVVYLDRRLPRIMRLSFPFPVFSFFSSFHITYPLFLPFVIRKNEFDYFIVHGTYTSLSAVSFAKTKHIRFSAFIWDPASYILTRVYKNKFFAPVLWLLKKIAYVFDKFLIKNMDNVLVGGSAHNDFIRSLNREKPIRLIYPSVHPAKKLFKKDDYVLMVTAWKDGKNPEYVLEIINKLPDIQIKMVGKWIDPSYKQQFEGLVREKGYTNNLEIVGSVSEVKLTNYYAHARVLLQTNDDRGFGMPAMEAAANGTTFIIPQDQGVCSLFVDSEDGFYTQEKDTGRITALLSKLMNNEDFATDLGAHAWKKVKSNYSWENHAKKLRQLVSDSLKGYKS